MEGPVGFYEKKCETPKKKQITDIIANKQSNSSLRFMQNFSTPPNFMFKNPFDSPLRDNLHLPICSPNFMSQSTPNTGNKFKWSICEISHLKPADIDTQSFIRQYMPDYKSDPQIEHKISSFFSEQSIVPSPLSETLFRKHSKNVEKEIRLSENLDKISHVPDEILNKYVIYDENQGGLINPKANWEFDSLELKKIFEFEKCQDEILDHSSDVEEPLVLSPIKFVGCSNYKSEGLERKNMEEYYLSPIKNETDDMQSNKRCDSGVTFSKEYKSNCRFSFSEEMSIDFVNSSCDANVEVDTLSTNTETCDVSMKSLLKESLSMNNISCEMESKQNLFSSNEMQDTYPKTPRTGLFNQRSKNLSQSFMDLCNYSKEDFDELDSIKSFNTNGDTGYKTIDMDQTWKNMSIVSSTPTKIKPRHSSIPLKRKNTH